MRSTLTQEQLAQQVGCSRTMITRLLGDLVKGGYLRQDERRWRILRPLPPKVVGPPAYCTTAIIGGSASMRSSSWRNAVGAGLQPQLADLRAQRVDSATPLARAMALGCSPASSASSTAVSALVNPCWRA